MFEIDWNLCIKFCLMVYNRSLILQSLLVELCILHLSCTRSVQYLHEQKMGMKFYVIIILIFMNILKKNCTVQILSYINYGPGQTGPCRKTSAGRAGLKISARLTDLTVNSLYIT